MSEIKTSHNLDDLKHDFEEVLIQIAKVLKIVRPRTRIENTKLWKLKRDLNGLDGLGNESIAKAIELVTKYAALKPIFSEEIIVDKKHLYRLVEGIHDYELDSDDKYNDKFFELSMGVRFFQAARGKAKINLAGECDVVVNNEIAIECKYIHSLSSLIKNIEKADKQIIQRVSDEQAVFGFIAIDLSHVIPREVINRFAGVVFNEFTESYRSMSMSGIRLRGNLIDHIMSDKNFYKIISNYIMHKAESVLHTEANLEPLISENTVAVLYQTVNSFYFELDGISLPLVTRGMSYYPNPNSARAASPQIKQLIHGLAVGVY